MPALSRRTSTPAGLVKYQAPATPSSAESRDVHVDGLPLFPGYLPQPQLTREVKRVTEPADMICTTHRWLASLASLVSCGSPPAACRTASAPQRCRGLLPCSPSAQSVVSPARRSGCRCSWPSGACLRGLQIVRGSRSRQPRRPRPRRPRRLHHRRRRRRPARRRRRQPRPVLQT